MAITWRTLTGQTADPAALLRGAGNSLTQAQDTFNNVFDTRAKLSQQNWNQTVKNNELDFAQYLAGFTDPAALQRARESGEIAQRLSGYGAAIGTGALDDAEQRIGALQERIGADRSFQTQDENWQARELISNYEGALATADARALPALQRQIQEDPNLPDAVRARLLGTSDTRGQTNLTRGDAARKRDEEIRRLNEDAALREAGRGFTSRLDQELTRLGAIENPEQYQREALFLQENPLQQVSVPANAPLAPLNSQALLAEAEADMRRRNVDPARIRTELAALEQDFVRQTSLGGPGQQALERDLATSQAQYERNVTQADTNYAEATRGNTFANIQAASLEEQAALFEETVNSEEFDTFFKDNRQALGRSMRGMLNQPLVFQTAKGEPVTVTVTPGLARMALIEARDRRWGEGKTFEDVIKQYFTTPGILEQYRKAEEARLVRDRTKLEAEQANRLAQIGYEQRAYENVNPGVGVSRRLQNLENRRRAVPNLVVPTRTAAPVTAAAEAMPANLVDQAIQARTSAEATALMMQIGQDETLSREARNRMLQSILDARR